jgi:hypothetical protein
VKVTNLLTNAVGLSDRVFELISTSGESPRKEILWVYGLNTFDQANWRVVNADTVRWRTAYRLNAHIPEGSTITEVRLGDMRLISQSDNYYAIPVGATAGTLTVKTEREVFTTTKVIYVHGLEQLEFNRLEIRSTPLNVMQTDWYDGSQAKIERPAVDVIADTVSASQYKLYHRVSTRLWAYQYLDCNIRIDTQDRVFDRIELEYTKGDKDKHKFTERMITFADVPYIVLDDGSLRAEIDESHWDKLEKYQIYEMRPGTPYIQSRWTSGAQLQPGGSVTITFHKR